MADARPGSLRLSAVVPVYNAAATVGALFDRLSPVLEEVAPSSWEVIFVNDGSQDDSWAALQSVCGRSDRAIALDLLRNYGQHNALLCGLRAARGELIVTLDDDLQHPPEEIPKLLAVLEEGYDVVYGVPAQLPHSIWRNVLSRVTKWTLARAMGVRNINDISAFRLLRGRLVAACEGYRSPRVLLDVLLSWGTTRFGTAVVRHDPRLHGTSNYTFGKLVNQAVLILTGFSTAPLRLASLVGFASTSFGVAVLAYVLIRYAIEGGSVPGFPFLASTIAILSGAQLFALGVIGEYLARMFNRSMDRPTYVVGSRLEGSGAPAEPGPPAGA